MGRAILIKIAVTVIGGSIGGAIILLFGLNRVVASMIGEYPLVVLGIVLLISGLIGLIGLCLWIALGLEEKLTNRFSPRPSLGSLVYRDIIVRLIVTSGQTDLEVIVTLLNKNPELIAYTATMHGTMNGKQWMDAKGQSALVFSGFAAANGGDTALIMRTPNIPFQITSGFGRLDALSITRSFTVTHRESAFGRRGALSISPKCCQ